jgi:hypothetical protein
MKSGTMIESTADKGAANPARRTCVGSGGEGGKLMIDELLQKYDDLAARAAELRRFL